MQISESDLIITRAIEDCQLGKEEIIYFVSQGYPLLPRLIKNKPYSQIIGSTMPRIASKYRRDVNNYRKKLENFLTIISGELTNENYPGDRISKLQNWIQQNETADNTIK